MPTYNSNSDHVFINMSDAPVTSGEATPLLAASQPAKSLADSFADYTYECFWPVNQVKIIAPLSEVVVHSGDSAPNSPYFYQRGKPLALTAKQKYGGYAVMSAAMVVGSVSAYLYVPTSAAAAVFISQYSVFETIKGFLKPNIAYSGPAANALLNSELMIRMCGNMFKPKSAAEKALASNAEYWSNWACGGVSFVWSLAAISPMAYMDSVESRNTTEFWLSIAGAIASIPSFFVGARGAINFVGQTRLPCCGSYWLKASKAVLVNHMSVELDSFIALKADMRSQRIDELLTHFWSDGNEQENLESILPKLITIGQTNNDIKPHNLNASYLTWSLTGMLSVFRIMSLFGFTIEAYHAGIGITGLPEHDKGAKALGLLSAILTACAQAGLSIRSIKTIGEAASTVVDSIKNGTPLSEFSEIQPVVYYLLFFIAYYIGFFSGGTSAKAASEALSGWDDKTRQVFEAVSFAMSGVAVNGYFCQQLFKRVMAAYNKKNGTHDNKRYIQFVAAYRSVIEKISGLTVEQTRTIFCDRKVKPVFTNLLKAYKWLDDDIDKACTMRIIDG